MKKWIVLIIALTLLLAISFCGCSQEPSPPPVENAPAENTPPLQEPELEPAEPVMGTPDGPTPVNVSTDTIGWYFIPNKEHQVPRINEALSFRLSDYDAFYVGSQDEVIFLTFDEGYENGYTGQILDILKTNQVPAAFFATKTYIQANPELVERMATEGHIVANHSATHPSMPTLTENPESFQREINSTADAFRELTGREMPPYFRPPMGEYSEKSLHMTAEMGYKTIFWSFAYKDWLTDAQPDPDQAYQRIMEGTHNGEIILLHAVSSTNVQILDQLLKDLQNQGYRFASLSEISAPPAGKL